MIKRFLKERLSWILLFVCLQLLLLFIAYLDPAISLSSAVYVVFLSALIFFIFLTVRYHKETFFYQHLDEWEADLDASEIPEAATPFEKIVEERLAAQIRKLTHLAGENRLALEQERDDLLSWIHEVKTPLTALHLMIERIEDENIKSRLTYEWLRIHLLLDQQLHQKRMLFIENDLHAEKIALEPMISHEIKLLRSWCMQKGIGFGVDLQVEEVLSDHKWLAFIMRQLLTNAVKYSGNSEILVKSYMKHGHTVVEVHDFGIGIDPKDLPRIFDKGFTSAVRPDQAATGMGLYLAKKAAEWLMIQLHVTSVPGEGSTFTLIFPKKNEFVNLTSM
ncbi:sensor histidine kinase [Siminovitchia sediminis]|uniref:histidine kinase n=1 Tax=Siminovitchia sediminis TaxID=1274353 RepID=A0ABW4KCA8_9BACI